MGRPRHAAEPERTWGVVCAMARTWTTVEGQAITAVVPPVPRQYVPRTGVPRLPVTNGRQSCWRYRKRLCLRHRGDVTVGLSKTGRNVGPQHTHILVTNLPEVTPRYVVFASQKRWAVAQRNRALKTDLGRGEHQVTGEERRIEHSFGLALMASLFLLRLCHHELLPSRSWSVSQLQHALRLRLITNQVAHHVKTRLTKSRKAASLLAFHS